jgi:hypothetical protein
MEMGHVVLLTLALLTALNPAVHYYTHVVTYALFPVIAATAGGPGFVRYHQAYESRLPWSVYLPWSALSLTSLAFVFVHPPGVGPVWPVALLVLNVSIAPISLAFAAPVHRDIDVDGALSEEHASALLRWNAVRLLVAGVSPVVVTVLALQQLTPTG